MEICSETGSEVKQISESDISDEVTTWKTRWSFCSHGAVASKNFRVFPSHRSEAYKTFQCFASREAVARKNF